MGGELREHIITLIEFPSFGLLQMNFVLSATFYFISRDSAGWRNATDLRIFCSGPRGVGLVLQEVMGGKDPRRLCVQLMLLPEPSALPRPLASKSG